LFVRSNAALDARSLLRRDKARGAKLEEPAVDSAFRYPLFASEVASTSPAETFLLREFPDPAVEGREARRQNGNSSPGTVRERERIECCHDLAALL
jgi:hypothetical protein